MKSPARWLVLGFLLALSGCGRHRPEEVPLTERKLTPVQYQLLKDRDKVRYKNIVLRVPESWGGALLPFDPGPYPSPVDKAVHTGELAVLMGLYNQALFEFQHPRVKIEYINFDMWSDNFKSALAVALASNRAPAYYIARDLPQTIEQGMYADLTPLMKKWDQFRLQPEGSIRQGTVNGRIYTLAANELGATVIRYRKDWFREAGIFNERGEPGPPSDWTWDDFRRIARKLTDPERGRYGYCDQMGDYLYNQSKGLDLYLPDPTGRRTWVFNDRDPEVIRSLEMARALVNEDKSVLSSVSTGWFEWHNEFDASHAAMISSFSPHIPRECLESPEKFGKDKPYAETVGMAIPPQGDTGLSSLQPITNPIGFDPTLSREQLEAAFEWCKSWFYGDIFLNMMRDAAVQARIKGQKSTVYVALLTLPYAPQGGLKALLEEPLEKVFPRDYLKVYRTLRTTHAPPLPREFGLKEPPVNEFIRAVKAMYSEAVTGNTDLKALVARTALLVNTQLLNFGGGPEDRDRMRRYIAARTDFYRRHYPRYYRSEWQPKLERYYRVP
ncbi:MAG: extracellular solute-binding protein [Armatimonadetes bacterium]|nr:extracellular solute-binding protein [Armatimonadota bacterium]